MNVRTKALATKRLLTILFLVQLLPQIEIAQSQYSYAGDLYETKIMLDNKESQEKALANQRDYSFTFTRIKWTRSKDLMHLRHQEVHYWWADYPNAEKCFLFNLKLLTKMDVNPDSAVLTADRKELLNLPFAYLAEAGWVDFSEAEVKNLKKYFALGGFLMVDDFHGPMPLFESMDPESPNNEWNRWMKQVKRIFPDLVVTNQIYSESNIEIYKGRPSVFRLDMSHPIFNDPNWFKKVPDVYGVRAEANGYEFGGSERYVMGLFDADGRLAMVMAYNLDIGDGWEWCTEFGKTTYGTNQVPDGLRFGINFVFTALQ